jgi:hypothetical protein
MTSSHSVLARIAGITIGVSLAAAGLAACSYGKANPSASSTSSVTSKPEPKPTFVASGTASDNIAFVRALVIRAIKKAGLNVSSLAVARQLAHDGFDPKGIQYTSNSTAAGLKPDSVVVAAQIKGQCLIAQYGAGIGGVQIDVAPVLKSGGCLLGRSIQHL